jgi:mannose-6-phosphate isomerase-like protein (cupin superfamily)
MGKTLIAIVLSLALLPSSLEAQQRRATGRVTLVIFVADADGAPVAGARVTVTGPAERSGTTEMGRLAFENLPAGAYHLRFERDGFTPVERDLNARGTVPIDVKVTMTPAPRPMPPVAPPPPQPAAAVDAKPVFIDAPAFIEKNYVGRAAGKTSQLACGTGGSATLIQINEPLAEHTHADADEFLYVIAGDGTMRVGSHEERLRAGMFVLVPRGSAHTMGPTGRSPLVLLSMKAGDRCGDAGATRQK